MNKRELINHLRAQERDLSGELEACRLALQAFGANPRGRTRATTPSHPRHVERAHGRRVPNQVERETIRVVKEHGEPITVKDILTLGDFDCTQSGIYHAVRRNDQLELIDGPRLFNGRNSRLVRVKNRLNMPGVSDA